MIIIVMLVDFRKDVHISFSEESGYYEGVVELEIAGGGGNKI